MASNDINMKLKMQMDISSVEQEMAKVKSKVKQLTKDLEGKDSKSKIDIDTESVRDELTKLIGEISKLKTEANNVRIKFHTGAADNLIRELGKMRQALLDIKKTLPQIVKENQNVASSEREIKTEIQENAKAQKEFKESVDVSEEIKKSKEELKDLHDEVDKGAEESKDKKKKEDKYGFGTVPDNIIKTLGEKGNERLGEQLNKLNDAFESFAKSLFNVANDTVDSSVKFEKAFFSLSALQGVDQAKASLEHIRQVSVETGMSFNDVATAAINIAKTQQDVIGNLKPIVELSRITNEDIGKTSRTIARALNGERWALKDAMNDYGMTSQMLERYGAVITKAGTLSNKSLETRAKNAEAIRKAMADINGTNLEDWKLTTEGQIETTKAAIENLKIEIGNKLLPTVKEFYSVGQDIANWVTESKIPMLSVYAGGATLAIYALTKAIKGLLAAQMVFKGVHSLPGFLKAITSGITEAGWKLITRVSIITALIGALYAAIKPMTQMKSAVDDANKAQLRYIDSLDKTADKIKSQSKLSTATIDTKAIEDGRLALEDYRNMMIDTQRQIDAMDDNNFAGLGKENHATFQAMSGYQYAMLNSFLTPENDSMWGAVKSISRGFELIRGFFGYEKARTIEDFRKEDEELSKLIEKQKSDLEQTANTRTFIRQLPKMASGIKGDQFSSAQFSQSEMEENLKNAEAMISNLESQYEEAVKANEKIDNIRIVLSNGNGATEKIISLAGVDKTSIGSVLEKWAEDNKNDLEKSIISSGEYIERLEEQNDYLENVKKSIDKVHSTEDGIVEADMKRLAEEANIEKRISEMRQLRKKAILSPKIPEFDNSEFDHGEVISKKRAEEIARRRKEYNDKINKTSFANNALFDVLDEQLNPAKAATPQDMLQRLAFFRDFNLVGSADLAEKIKKNKEVEAEFNRHYAEIQRMAKKQQEEAERIAKEGEQKEEKRRKKEAERNRQKEKEERERARKEAEQKRQDEEYKRAALEEVNDKIYEVNMTSDAKERAGVGKDSIISYALKEYRTLLQFSDKIKNVKEAQRKVETEINKLLNQRAKQEDELAKKRKKANEDLKKAEEDYEEARTKRLKKELEGLSTFSPEYKKIQDEIKKREEEKLAKERDEEKKQFREKLSQYEKDSEEWKKINEAYHKTLMKYDEEDALKREEESQKKKSKMESLNSKKGMKTAAQEAEEKEKKPKEDDRSYLMNINTFSDADEKIARSAEVFANEMSKTMPEAVSGLVMSINGVKDKFAELQSSTAGLSQAMQNASSKSGAGSSGISSSSSTSNQTININGQDFSSSAQGQSLKQSVNTQMKTYYQAQQKSDASSNT